MSKVPVFVIGIILSILGLVMIVLNSTAPGPEAIGVIYWQFGGCLLSLTGILVVFVALIWPQKSVDLDSSEIGNEISIPPPVISKRD